MAGTSTACSGMSRFESLRVDGIFRSGTVVREVRRSVSSFSVGFFESGQESA
jgi:hypothetical protein